MSCLTTPLECEAAIHRIYSWVSFSDRDHYVLYHFLNPFLLYSVTQNFWFSFLMVYIWETFEALELTACGGTACVSGGNLAPTCAELSGFATDNLVGDVSQGLVGILTAMLFRVVLNTPDWSPSFRSLYSLRPDAVYIWLKRVLFYLALFSATFLASTLDEQITYGVHAGYLLGIFILFAAWNQTPDERRTFWTGRRYEWQLYWTIYGVWALWACTMIILVGHVPLGNSYQTFYFFIGVTWLALIIAAGFVGRFVYVMDFLSFGCFSIYSGVQEHRFLYDKKRFQNLPALLKLNSV